MSEILNSSAFSNNVTKTEAGQSSYKLAMVNLDRLPLNPVFRSTDLKPLAG